MEEGEGLPMSCPMNNMHVIDQDQTVEVDKIMTSEVSIKEEFVPTQGYYQSQGCELDIDGNIGSVTSMDHVWPYQVSILMGWFYAAAENVGDKIEAWAGGDTITGAIAAPVAINDTVITVTPTVIEHTAIGYHMKLFDGTNLSDIGRVVSIDEMNSQITIETPVDKVYSPLTPTYVMQTVRLIDDMFVNAPNVRYVFAEKKMGGKGLPPGVPISIRYTNRTGGSKKFSYNIEYIY